MSIIEVDFAGDLGMLEGPDDEELSAIEDEEDFLDWELETEFSQAETRIQMAGIREKFERGVL